MFASSQWETALLCNDVSHWLGASLESACYKDMKKKHNPLQPFFIYYLGSGETGRRQSEEMLYIT